MIKILLLSLLLPLTGCPELLTLVLERPPNETTHAQDAAHARCAILATDTRSCGQKSAASPKVKMEPGQILHIRGQAKVGMDDDDNVVVGRPKIVRVWFEGEDEE